MWIARSLTWRTEEIESLLSIPTPNVRSNNSDPVENKDPVVLTCEPETQNATYLWLVNRQSIADSAQLELSKDNRTLTLLRVTRNDTGPYECVTWNPGSAGRSDPFYLNVLYGPETPTISPSNPHYSSGANLSLSCHTASNPPAQYSWLINGRPQEPMQELFIPHITVNDSGSYTCLVHNSVTGLNRTTVQIITVSSKWLPGPSAPALGWRSVRFSEKSLEEVTSHLLVSQANYESVPEPSHYVSTDPLSPCS
ncbi:Carcinoembryonic antigen-related cell adhesion molecule 1 [Pteropus alecto]|uniref:Carcinoembryonic antigen-related cell adhesion molecule 1 n=1 Tax=Pteropus alecto TaxID=9402 RepID=L5KSE1_PTEAL|nr:Carcinoembryonic antigen-related cell adhesion molecule 1 [Pteropus alecto]